MLTLFDQAGHKNLYIGDLTSGSMVQANQHVIIDGDEAIVLDPGGHKVHRLLFAQLAGVLPPKGLKHLFFSHQDPDIVAAANAWLMVSDATGYLSGLWTRFVSHFGIDELVIGRIKPIPDEGLIIQVGRAPLHFIPAHFLHSPGNFQVYDPTSRILYSGDLGASLEQEYERVSSFDEHVRYMEGFHRRYMASNKALRLWARMVRGLDIETIAPQHGAMFVGREMVSRFIAWAEELPCGVDLLDDAYRLPA